MMVRAPTTSSPIRHAGQVLFALAGMLLGGCYAGLQSDGADDGADGGTDGSAADDATTDAAADDGSGTGGPEVSACDSPSAGPTPLRRLTRLEYDNALRDLLGVTSRPAHARFVPDETIAGFEANAVAPISAQRLDDYFAVAQSVAADAIAAPEAWINCDPAEEDCVTTWVRGFARRAFRRPVSDAEVANYHDLFSDARAQWDAWTGVRMVLEAILMAPDFLYQIEKVPDASDGLAGPVDAYELAARLSFFLWATIPDDALLDAAESGALLDPAKLEAEARRMLDDDRARDTLSSFHRQWLLLDPLREAIKSPTTFPQWSPELVEAMLAEPGAFATEVMVSDAPSLKTLLTAAWTAGIPELAEIYGVPPPAEGASTMTLNPDERAGLLTMPGLLARTSHANDISWVFRGKFVREGLLCEILPAPPPNVEVMPGNDVSRLEHPSCGPCHVLMDPIGTGFDRYDAIGDYHEVDANGAPISALGEVRARPEIGTFDGVPELASRLVGDPAVADCVARQWFRYAHRRRETKDDDCSVDTIQAAFAESDLDLRELVVGIVVADSFRTRVEAPADDG